MPLAPSTTTPRTSSTAGRRRATSSADRLGRCVVVRRGTVAAIAATHSSPIPAITPNDIRHPASPPITVVAGTPTTLATVTPSVIDATADERRSTGTSARDEQQTEVRRDAGERVACGEQAHEQQEGGAPLESDGRGGQQRHTWLRGIDRRQLWPNTRSSPS